MKLKYKKAMCSYQGICGMIKEKLEWQAEETELNVIN
jgi:hypothetical protein